MRPLTLLLVEDEPIVRQNIERHLKRHGHTVYSAWSVDGALKSLRVERNIDVVLLDILLNGARERGGLRIAGKTPRDTPIIVMSGGDEELIRAEAARNPLTGVVRWLRKPFQLDELLEALGNLPEEILDP